MEDGPLQHIVFGGMGRTSNIFALNMERAFAKSKNVHLPTWDFLAKNVNRPNLLAINLSRGNVMIVSISCGVSLPPD